MKVLLIDDHPVVREGLVKQHLSAAFRALQVANRTEAVYRAAELGIPLQPR